MDNVPFFSIIIPSYNRKDLLIKTVESVLVQTFSDYELIVVDDGSEDGSVEYFSQRRDLLFLRQGNKGPGAARNLGLRAATGKYICFLDSDDLWFPWTLQTFRNVIQKESDPAWVMGQRCEFSDDMELAKIQQTVLSVMRFDNFFDYRNSGLKDQFCGTCIAVGRTDVIKSSGGFVDELTNLEDIELFCKTAGAKGFVRITSPITMGYRQHVGSLVTNFEGICKGILYLVRQEREGIYDNCSSRRLRRRYFSRNALRVAFDALEKRESKIAFKLYGAALLWILQYSPRQWGRAFIKFPVLMIKIMFHGDNDGL